MFSKRMIPLLCLVSILSLSGCEITVENQSPSSSPSCSDPDPSINCNDTGCLDHEICMAVSEDCAPSNCSCDEENDTWVCTEDCQPVYTCEILGEQCMIGNAEQACNADERCSFEPGEICQEGNIGTCIPFMPQDCPAIEDPVCGCDGTTYSNECSAINLGVSVYTYGSCEDAGLMMCTQANPALTCLDLGCDIGEVCIASESDICIPSACDCDFSSGTWLCTQDCQPTYVCEVQGKSCVIGDDEQTCNTDERCSFEPGETCQEGDIGVCVPFVPEDCPNIEDPVCGCDGTTYSNECSAINLGVSVYAPGECDHHLMGESCIIGDDEQTCNADERCSFTLGETCQEGEIGVCIPFMPQDCPAIEDPVCGCDGSTYSNECSATNLGISVYAYGSCEDAGLMMCTQTNPALTCLDLGCPMGEECVLSESEVCIPSACTCDLSSGIWECTEDCEPAYSCELIGESCIIGDDEQSCAMDERCYFEPGETCQEGDIGICIPFIPEDCPAIEDPICGCDDTTYSNECSAINLGVSVAYAGPCVCRFDADQDGVCDDDDQVCNIDARPIRCNERPPSCPRVTPIPVVRGECYTGACTSWEECSSFTACASELDTDSDGLCDTLDPYCNLDEIPLVCNEEAPRCPENTVPLITNGCFNGQCGTWRQCSL